MLRGPMGKEEGHGDRRVRSQQATHAPMQAVQIYDGAVSTKAFSLSLCLRAYL
jgi:hypothetical protein